MSQGEYLNLNINISLAYWRGLIKPPLTIPGLMSCDRADSGMGELTAVWLANLGYKVYAGCYLDGSGEKLRAKVLLPTVLSSVTLNHVAGCIWRSAGPRRVGPRGCHRSR